MQWVQGSDCFKQLVLSHVETCESQTQSVFLLRKYAKTHSKAHCKNCRGNIRTSESLTLLQRREQEGREGDEKGKCNGQREGPEIEFSTLHFIPPSVLKLLTIWLQLAS